MNDINESTAIWQGLLPKEETQALEFVRQNPTWDGRGVIVGILDTGVDPGAVGLSHTSTGLTKVINVIDCSGSGDVSMSKPRAVDDDGCLPGFGKRRLKINPSWNNPTGLYRIGYKLAFELYPKELQRRVKDERAKLWSASVVELEATFQNELLSATNEKDTEEANNRIAQLRSLGTDSLSEDPGPVYDCLVFHDGDRWQAAVDVTETGDFSTVSPMTNYEHSHQFRRFSDLDALNFAVNIYDEGSVLSIVTDAGAHGTHVAGIVSAYHPDQPECNGVAPGAQIVSLKIGDSRLGSMETGVGLLRGLIEAVRCGCHIINMSYGEATSWDNYGAFIRLAEEVVLKHGIVFVASAGNNGPAMSTVGCPGGTSTVCMGIGACVTKSLMTTAYSMHSSTRESNYTWSSVGPTIDGALGVSIMAPGGAITSVPNWTLNKKKLMNGTSMSSPNAAGCIALLVSAAKAIGIPSSPTRIRRAVERSALLCPDVDIAGQGNGLIQVQRAWDWLRSTTNERWVDIPLIVKVNSERFSRGIYLRQPNEASTANSYQVSIFPKFPESSSANEKILFERRLRLTSTASWIQPPSHLLLLQEGKQFNVYVDPRLLSTGAHIEFIDVHDEDLPAVNSIILRIPVTVIRPLIIPRGQRELNLGTVALQSGHRLRNFIVPPPGCTFVDMHIRDERRPTLATALTIQTTTDSFDSVRSDPEFDDDAPIQRQGPADDDSTRTLAMHALQIFTGTPYRDNEHDKYLALQPGAQHVQSWAVYDEVTMELVLAPLWSSIGTSRFSIVLYFNGVVPVPRNICLIGGQRVSDIVRVRSFLSSAEISPSAKLDKWVSVTKPTQQGKVLPLGSRDVLPDGTRCYQLVIEYEFDQPDDGEVTLRWPGLQDILYESDFHAQFFMIYDAKKKLLGVGDAFPKGVKIAKGKTTIRYQVRHTSVSVLEGLSDICMLIERPLSKNISLSFFKMQTEALVGTAKMGSRNIAPGSSISMFVREPAISQLPKQASAGDYLVGSFSLLKGNSSLLGCADRPGGFPVTYIIGDTKVKSPATSTKEAVAEETSRSEQEQLESAIKEAKFKHLKSLSGKDASFLPLYSTFSADYPADLPLRQMLLGHKIKIRDSLKKKLGFGSNFGASTTVSEKLNVLESCNQVKAAAQEVISLLNLQDIAATLGVNADKENPTENARRKEAESRKSALIDALSAQAFSQLDICDLVRMLESKDSRTESASTENSESEAPESLFDSSSIAAADAELEDVCSLLKRWDDISADKYGLLFIRKHLNQGRWATVLKKVNELLASEKDVAARESLLEVREDMLNKLNAFIALNYSKKWAALAKKVSFDLF